MVMWPPTVTCHFKKTGTQRSWYPGFGGDMNPEKGRVKNLSFDPGASDDSVMRNTKNHTMTKRRAQVTQAAQVARYAPVLSIIRH